MSLVERFRNVWKGAREDAYGSYQTDGTKKGNKVGGVARTLRQPVTDGLFGGHLDGSAPIGLIPISPPDLAQWAAIDVDDYDFNHDAFAAVVGKHHLPVIHCRSKSGGAHIYFFLKEPEIAGLLRDEVSRIAAELGFAGSEIFPKQPNLTHDEVGNWINLPYANYTSPTRYAISHEHLGSLTIEEFIALAEERRTTLEELQNLTTILEAPNHKDSGGTELFPNGPPCLQSMAVNGVPEGGRNKALYNVALYCRKAFGDQGNWQQHVERINRTMMLPPLPPREVEQTLRSASKGLKYTCSQSPIKDFCQSLICSTRKFGVGEGDLSEFPQIIAVQVVPSDPPLFTVRLDGYREALLLRGTDILSVRAFKTKFVNQFFHPPPAISDKQFSELMRAALKNVQIVEMDPEEHLYSSPKGHMMTLLRVYLTGRPVQDDLEELLNGSPVQFNDTTLAFTHEGFREHLKKHHFRDLRDSEVYETLRLSGAIRSSRITIGSERVRVYLVAKEDLSDAAKLRGRGDLNANGTNPGTTGDGKDDGSS